jgi:hypothetical protein
MRLLQLQSNGDYSLTQDFTDDLPPYAILSHTWGIHSEEVTFHDLVHGTGKSKAGYHKIRFCGNQALQDGLQFFWVDTCCIDKSNMTELTYAINSMFRWYQNAARCYVYMSDVSTRKQNEISGLSQSWETAFQRSRWFTRAWTIQELLAPSSVEFFSSEGMRLGDKKSMEQQIHEITGIAIRALRGDRLSTFSADERMSWTKNRTATHIEDIAYSLLGIFGVFMPPIYGEGKDNAHRRLKKQIEGSRKEIPQGSSSAQIITLYYIADH